MTHSSNQTGIFPQLAYVGPVPSTREIFEDLSPAGGYIYVFWGYIEQPLYVGMSTNIAGRFSKHRSRGWWILVSRVELYKLQRIEGEPKDEFRRRLHEFELSAINHLRPTEDIAGVCC